MKTLDKILIWWVKKLSLSNANRDTIPIIRNGEIVGRQVIAKSKISDED